MAPPKIKTNPNGLVFIFGSPTPLRTFRFYAKSGSQIRRRARTACEVAARRDFLPAGQTSGWQLSYVSGKENKRVGLNFWKFHPISDVSLLCEIRFATSRKKPTSYWILRADFCLNFLKNLANTQSIRRGFFVVQPKILSAKTMLILNHSFFITTRVQLFTACPRASRLRGRGKARFPARRATSGWELFCISGKADKWAGFIFISKSLRKVDFCRENCYNNKYYKNVQRSFR